MSGTLLTVVEGALGSVAQVAESSGSASGEGEAKTLAYQIHALSGGIGGIAAADVEVEANTFDFSRYGLLHGHLVGVKSGPDG